MKINVLCLFLIASISGVIGDSGPDAPPIVINNKNHTDVPTASTLPAIDPNSTTTTTTTTGAPTTTIPSKPTTLPTTTPPSNSTTTAPTTPSTTTSSTTTTTTTTTPAPSNGTTTTKPTISTTTESTTVVPTGAPSHKGRKFDGPSFIGGIILASGLMAICFVSWKFYKARTERNYHTL